MTPTARTLKQLRSEGWQCQVVERFCHFSKRRIDLFGCIDIVAIKPSEGTLGVQATSGANTSARVSKARELVRPWLEAGNAFQVHGWRKLTRGKKRPVWEPQIVRLGIIGGEVVTL